MRALALAAGMALSSGCALVSGLANLEVTDGAAPPADAADEHDEATLPEAEAGPPIEAGPAGYALMAAGGCASTGVAISLSNQEFTLALWLRVDAQPTGPADVEPIVWNGGRGASEPGWSLDLTPQGVEFCVADQNAGVCTTTWPIVAKHLVHVVVTSPYNGNASGRGLNLYAHDLSDTKSTTHTLVASATGAEGNWTTSAPFTIGGAKIGASCSSPAHVTVDRVQLATGVVPTSLIDSLEAMSECKTPGITADYEFDEGSGSQAKDCSGAAGAMLTLEQDTSFVLSPFE